MDLAVHHLADGFVDEPLRRDQRESREARRDDDDAEVTFGNGVYRYKRTPLPEEVARIAGLVAEV